MLVSVYLETTFSGLALVAMEISLVPLVSNCHHLTLQYLDRNVTHILDSLLEKAKGTEGHSSYLLFL